MRHRSPARRAADGYTLIEVLIVCSILVLVLAGATLGIGNVTRANLRSSTVMVSAAIRTGYTRAVTRGNPVRLVLDLEAQKLWLEETEDRLVLSTDRDDTAAGAAPSVADADAGPPSGMPEPPAFGTDFQIGESNAPKYRAAHFQRIEGSRFEPRELPSGVRFLAVYTAHTEGRQEEGLQYLFFWPGGMTERAVIQLADKDDETTYSVIVHPLTGRTRIENVPVEPEADLADEEEQQEEAVDDQT